MRKSAMITVWSIWRFRWSLAEMKPGSGTILRSNRCRKNRKPPIKYGLTNFKREDSKRVGSLCLTPIRVYVKPSKRPLSAVPGNDAKSILCGIFSPVSRVKIKNRLPHDSNKSVCSWTMPLPHSMPNP